MVTAALFACYDCMFESHLQILYVKVLTPSIMVFGGNWVTSCHPFPPMRIRGEGDGLQAGRVPSPEPNHATTLISQTSSLQNHQR